MEYGDIMEVGTCQMGVGFVDTPTPGFAPESPEDCSSVMVKVTAFSCGYRDKALAVTYCGSRDPAQFLHIGSDFVGTVIAVGNRVTDLRVGDRVINNNHYPARLARGVSPGIPTNHASARLLRLHELKLTRISPSIPTEVAAAFGVSGQTSYSILRRLQPRAGERGLVTAARSATSQCVLSALRNSGTQMFALSTGTRPSRDLSHFDVSVIRLPLPVENVSSHELVRRAMRQIGGFDFIIDPYADLYLDNVISLLRDGGRYISCGLLDQFPPAEEGERRAAKRGLSGNILAELIVRNLTIMGNCLGTTADLETALLDYSHGDLSIPIDSVFTGVCASDYLRRSFSDTNRLGRAVFQYESDEHFADVV